MKKVLITGGLGYIGMELAKIYSGLNQSYDVTVIDNQFFSLRVNQLKIWGIKFQQLDILDKNNIKYEFKAFDQGHGVNSENLKSFLHWLEDKY